MLFFFMNKTLAISSFFLLLFSSFSSFKNISNYLPSPIPIIMIIAHRILPMSIITCMISSFLSSSPSWPFIPSEIWTRWRPINIFIFFSKLKLIIDQTKP